jgi:hypothetical protein
LFGSPQVLRTLNILIECTKFQRLCTYLSKRKRGILGLRSCSVSYGEKFLIFVLVSFPVLSCGSCVICFPVINQRSRRFFTHSFFSVL